MTKADIVRNVQEKTAFTLAEAVDCVEATLEIVKQSLEAGESVKVSGFGNFLVKQKNDRKGRNPQTGEAITIESRTVVTYKPSHVLKDSMNGI